MNKTEYHQRVSFHYLVEVRQWLYSNLDVEIIDIETIGEWEQMEFVIIYNSGKKS